MSSRVTIGQRRWFPAPQEGVEVCILHSREDTCQVAALIRMCEGAKLPWHGHAGGEHLYVLKGRVSVDGELVQVDDYHYTPVGEAHDVVAQERCLLLSVLPKDRR